MSLDIIDNTLYYLYVIKSHMNVRIHLAWILTPTLYSIHASTVNRISRIRAILNSTLIHLRNSRLPRSSRLSFVYRSRSGRLAVRTSWLNAIHAYTHAWIYSCVYSIHSQGSSTGNFESNRKLYESQVIRSLVTTYTRRRLTAFISSLFPFTPTYSSACVLARSFYLISNFESTAKVEISSVDLSIYFSYGPPVLLRN